MKKKKKKQTFKEFISSYTFMYSALIVLFLLVVVLSILVIKAKNNYNKNKVNLVVPVLSEGTNNNLKVDLNAIYQYGKYVIKITNYRGNEVNEEEANYSITIKNNTDNSIKIVKDNDKENLMVNQEETTLSGLKLRAKKKEDTKYTITLDSNKKPKENSIIDIEIFS